MKPKLTDKEILNLPIGPNDAGDDDLTIKGYLKELLAVLWLQGEGFNSKRPFGNSGWQLDLNSPLIKAGLVAGNYNREWEYYEFEDYDSGRKAVDKIILRLIKSL